MMSKVSLKMELCHLMMSTRLSRVNQVYLPLIKRRLESAASYGVDHCLGINHIEVNQSETVQLNTYEIDVIKNALEDEGLTCRLTAYGSDNESLDVYW